MIAALRSTDKVPPQISVENQELTLSIHEVETKLLEDVTAWDEKDGDVTDSLVVESLYGITEDSCATVIYAAFDKSGNVTKLERQIRLSDYRSPRFTLSRAMIFEFGNVKGVLDAVGAEDILEGDIRQRVKATMLTEGASVSAEGTHEVQFRVTNSMGDGVQIVLPVEVYPVGSYNAELTLEQYLVYLPKGAYFEANSYLQTLKSRQIELNLRSGSINGLKIDVDGHVDTKTPGVYSITYTVSYTDANNEKITGYSRLMVVVEG